MAQRQLNDAPDAILSCGIEAEIWELRLSVCYIPFRFERNFQPQSVTIAAYVLRITKLRPQNEVAGWWG